MQTTQGSVPEVIASEALARLALCHKIGFFAVSSPPEPGEFQLRNCEGCSNCMSVLAMLCSLAKMEGNEAGATGIADGAMGVEVVAV